MKQNFDEEEDYSSDDDELIESANDMDEYPDEYEGINDDNDDELEKLEEINRAYFTPYTLGI